MNSPAQQNPGPFQSMRGNFNLALFICRTWATSLEVFLHRDIGERYLGLQAAAVLLLVPLYLLGWEGYDVRAVVYFLPAYLLMCVVARMGSLARRTRGEQSHSMYTGWPRCMGPRSKWTELTVKQFVEPGIVFANGWMLRELHEAPLGTYLMIGAVCLFISVSSSTAMERLRAMDLNDAVKEQEFVAERLRGMRDARQ